MPWIPEKYNKKWGLYLGASSLICLALALLVGGIVSLGGGRIGPGLIFLGVMVFLANLGTHLAGFLGARVLYWVVEPASLGFGFVAMLTASVDQAGWEILSGVLVYIVSLGLVLVFGGIMNIVMAFKKKEDIGPLGQGIWKAYLAFILSLMLVVPWQLDFEPSPYHRLQEPTEDISNED